MKKSMLASVKKKGGELAHYGSIVPKKEILLTNLFIFKSRLSSKKR
jgi:hypothetical protein